MDRDKIVYSIWGLGFVWGLLILVWEYLIITERMRPTWLIIPIELMLVGIISLSMIIAWPRSGLAKVGALCLFGVGVMGIIIELENLQPYITEKTIVGCILLAICMITVGLLYDWATKPCYLVDVEVIEVKPL